MENLRIRLCFQSASLCNKNNSWYLLNRAKLETVGEFLADVKQKFCINSADKLICQLKGFVLPPWENIAVIRDEDEITIEKHEDARFLSFVEPQDCMENNKDGLKEKKRSRSKKKDEKNKENGEQDNKRCSSVDEATLSLNEDELPSAMIDDSFCDRLKKKMKKKKEKAEFEDEACEGLGVKLIKNYEKDSKRRKKDTERIDMISATSVGKKKNKNDKKNEGTGNDQRLQNDSSVLQQVPALDGKKSCKMKETKGYLKDSKSGKKEKTKEKDEKTKSIGSDKTNERNIMQELQQKAESSESKSRKKSSAKATTGKKKEAVSKITQVDMKGSGRKVEKPTQNGSNGNSKEQICKEAESSFQILSKSVKNYEEKSFQSKKKSKISGNHVYFDSDDDDNDNDLLHDLNHAPLTEPINAHNGTSSNASCSAFLSSTQNINMSSNLSQKTCHGNGDKISKTQFVHLGYSAIENVMVDTLSDQVNESHQGCGGESMMRQRNEVKDYGVLTPLQGAPRAGDQVAFKVLEMSLSYTPEISDYKEAVVQEIDDKGIAKLLLADKSKGRKTGDGTLTRKFELESESEPEDEDVLELHWKELIDPKLMQL